jgi:hypothetical protein
VRGGKNKEALTQHIKGTATRDLFWHVGQPYRHLNAAKLFMIILAYRFVCFLFYYIIKKEQISKFNLKENTI